MEEGDAPSMLGFGTAHVLNYASLLLSYMLLTKVCDWTASGFFLSGLTHFQLVDPSTQLSTVSAPAPTSKKQEKKQLRHNQLLKSSTYNVAVSVYQQRSLARLEFYETFDVLMSFGLVLLVNCFGLTVVQHILGVGKAHLPLNLAAGMVLYTLYCTYQMEWAHEVIKVQDKWGMAVFGVIGAGLAASLLSLAPPSALGFDASAAADELMHHVSQLMQAKYTHFPDGTLGWVTPEFIRAALVVILTFIGGAISGLLLAPGLRFGRLVLQALFPPLWSRNYITYSTWERGLLRAAFALPFLVVAVWVTPLTGVLQIPLPWLPAMRLLVVLATAAVYLAMLHSLVQSFLYTALLKWYLLRHDGVTMDEATRGARLQRNFYAVDAQTCKVALQMAIMPCLLSMNAGMLALKSLRIGAMDGPSGQPSQLWQLMAGFTAWWACMWWCLYSMMPVVFVRLGVLGTNQGVF